MSPPLAVIRQRVASMASPGHLALFAVMLLVLYILYRKLHSATSSASNTELPGCTRLGIRSRSNLERQYDPSTTSSKARVYALFAYPVKSCRGVEMSTSDVTGLGLKHDRLFSFAQLVSKRVPASEGISETSSEFVHEWRFITQREFPRLALLETELYVPSKAAAHSKDTIDQETDWPANGGCLIIRFPYETGPGLFKPRTETLTLKIPLIPSEARVASQQYPREQLTIWKDRPFSFNMTSEINPEIFSKLKYFLGVSNPLGLFRVDDLNLRSIKRSLPKDRADEAFSVGFADAFPVSLMNIASVRSLDSNLPNTSAIKGKLDATRFRANVYISGPPAYAEDRWMRIVMGQAANAHQAQYHVACRTARCKLPNVHPRTGLKDRNEPHATMRRIRQVDEGAKPNPCLGLSMIPLFGTGEISVGDEIEVLQTGELVYEKMFK